MKNDLNYVNLVESYSRYKRDGRGAKTLVFLTCMVRILDGSSEYDPGVLREIGNSIFLSLFFTSTAVSTIFAIGFSSKKTCLPSHGSNLY